MKRAVAAIVFALLSWAERTPITLSPTLIHDGEQVSILSASPTAHTLYATPTRILRPLRRGIRIQQPLGIDWEEVDTLAPDVADLGTLQELAAIAGNAYALNPGRSKNWYDLPDYWNATLPIGDSSETMMRGHVFVDTRDNATVVISIKGTTLPFTGPTSGEDRRNDNLMFSCCCARSKSVCGCFGKKWTCDTNCVEDALTEDTLFYNFGIVSSLRSSSSSSSTNIVFAEPLQQRNLLIPASENMACRSLARRCPRSAPGCDVRRANSRFRGARRPSRSPASTSANQRADNARRAHRGPDPVWRLYDLHARRLCAGDTMSSGQDDHV